MQVCYVIIHACVSFYFVNRMPYFRLGAPPVGYLDNSGGYDFNPPSLRHQAMIFARKLFNRVSGRSVCIDLINSFMLISM